MGFIRLKSRSAAENKKTGDAILEVINSDGRPGSARAKFKADPKTWLFDHGYVYTERPGGPVAGDGRIPNDLQFVVVEDEANKMHVRIPFRGDVDATFSPPDDSYGGRYPVFMARYFMRRCR
jgi:hypothetical protein